jgi:hypothetical protein
VLRFLFYLIFLIPLCFLGSGWWLIHSLFFLIISLFIFYFPCFMVWGNLGYIFGCDYISYGLILLSFWICVLIITARESVFYSLYNTAKTQRSGCCTHRQTALGSLKTLIIFPSSSCPTTYTLTDNFVSLCMDVRLVCRIKRGP